ncbi:urate hydroxylase PuuD [Roseococcus sp. SDR]|uniref:urate hydroxylase PuuD n=1 Tax=Roseococcus sp. SDR TaxID=2835532 RepID=UPI001BD0E0F4|nr:urate hydroxylase PuuD [Roseococcus sp. SDR]MBS7790933.1 urate hydroxylase PuuD [Roseococcus sp. SDR]MBV1846247.1 urate hydroxylase PuuD [Roseococcus sp. SDR]
MEIDAAYVMEWANLLLRWLHIITGIAWIGASFYFISLDMSLEPPKDGNPLVRGEQWSLHGGGFYYKRKYKGAPEAMPTTLHWFKWEAYWTWLSGFSLFMLIYWGQASTYLIDPAVLDMAPWVAILVSALMIVVGWVGYDMLCKRMADERKLLLAGSGLLVVLVLIATHIFSGRGAFLLIGAITGTIMVANVAMVIIPGQKKMVRSIEAGEAPDPIHGQRGLQRSVHNTYLTLPVLLLMISPHYPMLYQHKFNWLVLILIAVAGALIRQFFVLRHTGRSNWALPAGGVVALGLLALLVAPRPDPRFAGVELPAFEEVQTIVASRCAACHAARPSFEGVAAAPKGVLLDSPAQIRRWAAAMRQQVQTEAMPPGNVTDITDEERGKIIAWVAAGAPAR